MSKYNRRGGYKKPLMSKKDWKNLLITVVVVILTLTLVSGGATLFKADTKTIHPVFTVGGIDEYNGEHVDTEGSIYTKNAFECKGLAVQLDFDSHVTYQAFFYDDLDNFISASHTYDQGAELDVPEDAVYARLEVTPIWEEINVDEEADEDAEPENIIKWFDVSKYADQLTITVLKEQGNDEENADVVQKDSIAFFSSAVPNTDFSKMVAYNQVNAPFSYGKAVQAQLVGKTITKIGVPVMELTDCTTDTFLTVMVVDNTSAPYSLEEGIVLKIEANTFSTNTPNEYVYFDVDITLKAGQTLAFGSSEDTVKYGLMTSGALAECGPLANKVLTANSISEIRTACLMFDIYVEE